MRVACVALVSILSAANAFAQSASTEFDVASVKPGPRTTGTISELLAAFARRPPPGEWRLAGVTLQNAIILAYPEFRLPGLLVGGPDWAKGARFYLEARMSATATHAEVQTMFRHLLEDRFALQTHIEKRTLDVYLLTLATPGKLGPGLTPARIECVKWRMIGGPLPDECDLYRRGYSGSGGTAISVATIADLVNLMTMTAAPSSGLSSAVDRPVMDRTGLEGYFQMIGPSAFVRTGFGAESSGSFFTLLQEQLGLKLTRAREMVDVLVIDSAAMPEPD